MEMMSFAGLLDAFSDNAVTRDGGWRFLQSDGLYAENKWKQIEDKWYYFDEEGLNP